MPAVVIKESTQSEDHDLVYEYTKGRNTNDPVLPYEIGINFLNGEKGFFKSIDFAVKWLKISTGMGCVPAKVALAEVYLVDTKKYGYRDACSVAVRKGPGLRGSGGFARYEIHFGRQVEIGLHHIPSECRIGKHRGHDRIGGRI